mmetsp:Transcript_2805/g.3907  ORF Transcript_2805/g.3907 Transcript_2805/m.3907 type:complete len:473 (-) Transcript_2805:34-1452(-)|eukprot:CAMPEP_0171480088 /NCGR_PEP_ID=MMETSP0946-20130122/5844_1 /TAXON_ID=109269 /ORGANISM="Vaucheria litorea, Strain CCMP2940" /LENGTH=472 /DNA_ID=CAMNT_0012011207 /DNA_START=13 /DNA_END=1431 /DNA_ORIENTATION=+
MKFAIFAFNIFITSIAFNFNHHQVNKAKTNRIRSFKEPPPFNPLENAIADFSNKTKQRLKTNFEFFGGAAIAISIFGSVFLSPFPSLAEGKADETAQIGTCVLNSCKAELAQCLLNPKCLSNLICIQSCTGKSDETQCQIQCGNLFENEVVGKFNACALSQKKCVPQKKDDNTYPVPPLESLAKSFDTSIFNGRWYISAGLNPLFDIFDCQVHFFTNPSPGQVYAKLNWRIEEPDGEFFTRDTVQRFIQDEKNPAILYNHDNEYLHYQDDWYILDSEPDSHVLIYYRGENDAWIGYGGAVLYTRDSTVPADIIPRVAEACQRAGIKWEDFTLTDNSCKPQTENPTLLRAEYTRKLLLLEENKLSEQLTAVRGYAADSLKGPEKEIQNALKTLENLRETYQNEIAYDALELEDILSQELAELKDGARYETEIIKEGIIELENKFIKSLDANFWKIQEAPTLSRLQKKVESAQY